MVVKTKKRYSRERDGKAEEMSYAMMPERMALLSAYVRALASMSTMLSRIWRFLTHDWCLETSWDATCEAAMSNRLEMVLLSVLESDIGRVSFGYRWHVLLWSSCCLPFGGKSNSEWLKPGGVGSQSLCSMSW